MRSASWREKQKAGSPERAATMAGAATTAAGSGRWWGWRRRAAGGGRRREGGHGASDSRSICVTAGSADALSKTFDALLDESNALLVESPTFSGSLAYLQPIGCKLVGVPCDGGGLDPDALERVLRGWDAAREGCPRPRVLLCCPTGSNPTGASLSEAQPRVRLDHESGLHAPLRGRH